MRNESLESLEESLARLKAMYKDEQGRTILLDGPANRVMYGHDTLPGETYLEYLERRVKELRASRKDEGGARPGGKAY